MEPKNLLSIQDAAKLLNVSTKTLRRWEKSGKLVPQRTEGNHRRYPKSQIEEYLSNSKKANKKESKYIRRARYLMNRVKRLRKYESTITTFL